MQTMQRTAHLVLEDGTVFPGRAVGAPGVAAGEACFTTASTGYEEAATDPSYVAQVLCFAYPLVGNYGVDPGRAESGRIQAEAGLEVTVVPGDWDADAILELEPRAVLIGNGPGDPAVLGGPIETVRDLLGRVPLFGICLGHQLLGLALDFPTFKLPFGHRGANHPVRDARTGRVLVTVQNHVFAV